MSVKSDMCPLNNMCDPLILYQSLSKASIATNFGIWIVN